MWHPYPGFSDWAMADGLLIVFSNAKWERLKSKWETECRGNVVGTKCRGMSWECRGDRPRLECRGDRPRLGIHKNVVGMSWGQAPVGHPRNVVGTGPGWASTNLQIARVLFVFVSIRVNSWTTSTLGDRLRLLFEAHWGTDPAILKHIGGAHWGTDPAILPRKKPHSTCLPSQTPRMREQGHMRVKPIAGAPCHAHGRKPCVRPPLP